MLKLSALLCAVGAVRGASDELKVEVTFGPTECDDNLKVAKGKVLEMHYTGTIDESSATGEKGFEFSTTEGSDKLFAFIVGDGKVIKAWDEGFIGLCQGAKATLIAPPSKAYGDKSPGEGIPAGATLRFEVEIMTVKDKKPEKKGKDLFSEVDLDAVRSPAL